MTSSEQISNKIEYYLIDQQTIVVIKGIDIGTLYNNLIIEMDKVLLNKLEYFMDITRKGRRVITYDEYLALYDFVITQYQKIIILENNIFINFYPDYVKMADAQLQALVNHYDEEKEGGKYEIGNIVDLSHIYGNIKAINGRYYITYNNIITNEKEQFVQLYNSDRMAIEKEMISLSDICYEIIDEEDYINMLDDLLHSNTKEIYIINKNTSISKLLLEEKIRLLVKLFYNTIKIKIGIIEDFGSKTLVRQEYADILKRYWNYNQFRKIKIYNVNRLSDSEKVIEEIPQNRIISDIVDEVIRCIKKEDYRDIFVTAPTGSGKSVIFQIPAIYLAEKYQLFTIVISPLIGLMKDQVENLELHNCTFARTINSDISPVQKQEIINDISDYKCHILYISPESLLSKSDLDQIIGDRALGLLVVDEAHIVTTWGKQFRPDYWYLGDHLSRLKKSQLNKKDMGFVIATFTATAIYGGIENMYEETVQSLKMVDPITYLGYMKREDIVINIEKAELIRQKTEYELNKFDQLIEKIDYALMLNKKMLVYFPTVALINRFHDYCYIKGMNNYVAKYHGQLTGYEKEESYRKFLKGDTLIMLATKAFGMGIDINDIEIVVHFAPTGNVCDYVQEIGRVARKTGLIGEAYYKFMKNDFKHINRLHGLSVIKEYQLIEVIRKVYELHQENVRNKGGKRITKQRNEMLIDAESFSHIFENPFFNEDDGINKVKTAMLLIQKDFERRFAFSPFHVRPIPLFETGYFKIGSKDQKEIKEKFGPVLQEVDRTMHICSVNLKKIWEAGLNVKHSFPKFKYMLYTKDGELNFIYKDSMQPALSIEIDFQNNYLNTYGNYIKAIKTIVNRSVRGEKFYDVDGSDGLVSELMRLASINWYKAKSIIETMLSAMSVYQRDYSKNIHGKVLIGKALKSGEIMYRFTNGTAGFFRWIDNKFRFVLDNLIENTLYLIDDTGNAGFKEILLVLGILETLDILVFKALGGKNSQIYIYVNQTKTMKEIIERPRLYKNRLLELINERHEVSVEMLTYIFEGEFSNKDNWELLENYFLGIIPNEVKKKYEKKTGRKLEEMPV